MRSDYKNLRSGYLDNTNSNRRIERFEQPFSDLPQIKNLFDNNDIVYFYLYAKKNDGKTRPMMANGNLILKDGDDYHISLTKDVNYYLLQNGLYDEDKPEVYYYDFNGYKIDLKSGDQYKSIYYKPKNFMCRYNDFAYTYLNFKINNSFEPVNPFSENYTSFMKKKSNETITECFDKIILSTTMLNKDFTEPIIPNVALTLTINQMKEMKISTRNEKIDGKKIYYIHVNMPFRKKDCIGEYSEVYNPDTNLFVNTLKSVKTEKQCGGNECPKFIPPMRDPTPEENKNRCCVYIDDGYDETTNKMKQKYIPITPTPPNCNNFVCAQEN